MSTIKILTLYKDLLFSLNEEEITSKEECLFTFDDTFKKGAELQQGEYLKNKQFLGFSSKEKTENSAIIPQGKYMFLQQESATDFSQEDLEKAAEELFLETLWEEREFSPSPVYLRVLEEEGKKVFQLFKAIKA